MQTHTHNGMQIAALFIGAMLWLTAYQAYAGRPRSEEQATAVARALVIEASQGSQESVSAAFQSAQQLRRVDDKLLANTLDQEKAALLRVAAAYGMPKRIQLSDESHLADCITREFRVRYANNEVRWVIKFRPGNGGYYLYGLTIVGLGA